MKRSTSQRQGRHDDTLAALLDFSQKLNAERDLVTLLDLMAREATRLMAADRASVFLLNREKSELWSIVALGSEPIRLDARLGIAGAVAMTGQTINVADVQSDPRFYSQSDARTGYRTRTILAVPFRNSAGEIIGTFEVLNKKDGVFTQDDEKLLQTLVAQAATALETAQLVEELRQQRDQLLGENAKLWQEVEGRFATKSILGTSEEIQQVVRMIERIRDSTTNVLITGESGTGKERVARAIHYSSPRARHPWVALNCAALPESLVESELFGIERGVATGVERRIGKFEAADGGTLFLDEVGELSPSAQAKLLRVLQEPVVERIGGRKPIRVDVRILAATNKNLWEEIKKGGFREDLYYRLNVIQIHLPPLREVPEDIPLLANHFLSIYGQEMKKGLLRLSPGALRCLSHYPWPGNVRELENEIKRVVTLARQETITEEDISAAIRNHGSAGGPPKPPPRCSLKETVAELEQQMIREALQACQQNQQQAAKMLGLSRQGLIKKMKRYSIAPATPRRPRK
ncbi:MAG: sigma 54-interacting transcriptional regulator [Candidatus Tectomicrobia bacterium]|uniref:Sigma 54-interacting transcriptional regulator n=1 Tax=Tectimicrobiota bacterium TaxID=2528274 RepID=A0A932CQF5_UNCTE|nr:sigma 54-interacting transcriptional regulator [Candidatus Tectomicrobia bacterium]